MKKLKDEFRPGSARRQHILNKAVHYLYWTRAPERQDAFLSEQPGNVDAGIFNGLRQGC